MTEQEDDAQTYRENLARCFGPASAITRQAFQPQYEKGKGE